VLMLVLVVEMLLDMQVRPLQLWLTVVAHIFGALAVALVAWTSRKHLRAAAAHWSPAVLNILSMAAQFALAPIGRWLVRPRCRTEVHSRNPLAWAEDEEGRPWWRRKADTDGEHTTSLEGSSGDFLQDFGRSSWRAGFGSAYRAPILTEAWESPTSLFAPAEYATGLAQEVARRASQAHAAVPWSQLAAAAKQSEALGAAGRTAVAVTSAAVAHASAGASAMGAHARNASSRICMAASSASASKQEPAMTSSDSAGKPQTPGKATLQQPKSTVQQSKQPAVHQRRHAQLFASIKRVLKISSSAQGAASPAVVKRTRAESQRTQQQRQQQHQQQQPPLQSQVHQQPQQPQQQSQQEIVHVKKGMLLAVDEKEAEWIVSALKKVGDDRAKRPFQLVADAVCFLDGRVGPELLAMAFSMAKRRRV